MNSNMQPNMQPYFFPNPNNMDFPNMDLNRQLRNIENRIYNLEKEVMNLRNKVSKLENTPTPYQDNFTSNYNPNAYNMM